MRIKLPFNQILTHPCCVLMYNIFLFFWRQTILRLLWTWLTLLWQRNIYISGTLWNNSLMKQLWNNLALLKSWEFLVRNQNIRFSFCDGNFELGLSFMKSPLYACWNTISFILIKSMQVGIPSEWILWLFCFIFKINIISFKGSYIWKVLRWEPLIFSG